MDAKLSILNGLVKSGLPPDAGRIEVAFVFGFLKIRL